jgi:hypothetical protein
MVKSEMLVNRQRWVVARCESAARDGFYGVDLTGTTGERVRIIPQPDETAQVIFFTQTGDVVKMDNNCARSHMPRTRTKINGVNTMDGWVTFACDLSGQTIEGRVEFEMCH